MRLIKTNKHRQAMKHSKCKQKIGQLLKVHAIGYTNSSTIHGLNYMTEKGRPASEKFCWLLVIISSVICCTFLVHPIYLKLAHDPTYTSVNSTNFPVWKIPFPGVTICSNIVVRKKILKQELETPEWVNLRNNLNQDIYTFSANMDYALRNILELYSYKAKENEFSNMNESSSKFIGDIKDYIPDLLEKVSHNCTEMLIKCRWKGKMVDCMSFFQVSRTDVGYCCSFNTVKWWDPSSGRGGTGTGTRSTGRPESGPSDSKRDGHKSQSRKQEHLPEGLFGPDSLVRSNSASSMLGLSMLLHVNRDEYYESEDDYYGIVNHYFGFKVLVHSPSDSFEVGGKGFALAGGKVAYIGVDARHTSSSESVRTMSIPRKNCINPSETRESLKSVDIELPFSVNYSRPGCILECRVEFIYQACGCLPHYFPDFAMMWNLTTTACNHTGLGCISENIGILRAYESIDEDSNEHFADGVDCYCPMGCEEDIYVPEVSQADIRDNSIVVTVRGEKYMTMDQKRNRALIEKTMEDKDSLLTLLEQKIQEFQDSRNTTAKEILNLEKERLMSKLTGIQEKHNELNKEELRLQAQKLKDIAMLHVYYKQVGIMEYSREEIYSNVDFLAAVGGLIGLCTGFSILSLMEVVYWFTYRMFNDYTRKVRGV